MKASGPLAPARLALARTRGRVSIFAGLAGEGWSTIAANLAVVPD